MQDWVKNNHNCAMPHVVEALRTCLVFSSMQVNPKCFPVLGILHMREPHSTKLQMPCLAAHQNLRALVRYVVRYVVRDVVRYVCTGTVYGTVCVRCYRCS